MEADLQTARRGQPGRGGVARAEGGTDEPGPDAVERRLIEAERIRVLFGQETAQTLFGVRSLHWLALLGAFYIGAATHWAGATPWPQVAAWWATVTILQSPTTFLVWAFAQRPRADEELAGWARARTILGALETFAWSLGPLMLHVRGEPGSIMIPTGGIVNVMASVVFIAACHPPTMITALFGVLLFPAVVLALDGGKVEAMLSICLFGALPFILLIGLHNAREVRAAIANRLRIVDLLAMQRRQTEIVQEARLARNRFFSAASHDLRQPLQALGVYLDLLPRSADAAERAEIEARIADCGAVLDRQFDAILGVASTDTELAAAEPRPAPLAPALERVAALFRPQAQAKGLTLEIEATAAWAQIAPDIFERVLSNLVANAIKYTQQGGVRVRVAPARPGWRILVADTGPGIPRPAQARVFEDYFQIGNAARDPRRGFGLGLGIVRRLCEGMGWPLQLRSREGGGSVFAFSVPDAATRPSNANPGAETVVRVATDASVLVVDDDALARDALARLVASLGFRVVAAETGAEAQAAIAAEDPARRWLALIDWRLSGDENGIELAERLIALRPAVLRAAILTGEASAEVEAAAARLGVPVLAKPIRPIALRAWLMQGAV